MAAEDTRSVGHKGNEINFVCFSNPWTSSPSQTFLEGMKLMLMCSFSKRTNDFGNFALFTPKTHSMMKCKKVLTNSLATLDKILWEAVKSRVACIGCKCGQCLTFRIFQGYWGKKMQLSALHVGQAIQKRPKKHGEIHGEILLK